MFKDQNLTEDQQIDAILAESSEEAKEAGDDTNVSNTESGDTSVNDNTNQFDPTQWTLNYKGQTITPKDRDQLIAYAQKGIGYEQSMSLINQEKQRIQEAMNQVKPYMELDRRFREDPKLQEYLSKAISEYNGSQNDPNLNNPLINELYSKVTEFENFKLEQERKAVDSELQNEINNLKNQFPDEPWDVNEGDGTFLQKVLKHAYDNNIPSLKTAYRDIAFENVVANTRAQALKEAETKRLEAQKGKVGGGKNNTTNNTSVAYNSEDSYNDLVAKALAMLDK